MLNQKIRLVKKLIRKTQVHNCTSDDVVECYILSTLYMGYGSILIYGSYIVNHIISNKPRLHARLNLIITKYNFYVTTYQIGCKGQGGTWIDDRI